MSKVTLLTAIFITSIQFGCASKLHNEVSSTTYIGGSIKLSYDKSGNLLHIDSTASSRVLSTLPSAREEASTIAGTKARRTLVEFLNTEVSSDRFISTLSTSLQEGFTSSGETGSKTDEKIAYRIQEEVRQKSSGLIKGAYLKSERYDKDSNSMVVVVRTTSGNANVYEQIKRALQQN